ncbi:MAG: hypothetical protein N3A58_02065 [Spirochaetes bacterium]|nr:hypothetical protein [Spirochaetota bacterium]
MKKITFNYLILLILILIIVFSFNIYAFETDFDFGIGIFGLDLKLLMIYNFGNINLYGNVGYYGDYFFNNLTNNFSGVFSGDIKNVKANYFTVGGKVEFSFMPINFLILSLVLKNQSYVYFSPGSFYTNAGYLEKQFYYLNRISLNSIISIIKVLDGEFLKNCWLIDLSLNYYPKSAQNPLFNNNLIKYSLTSYIKFNILRVTNIDISYYNLFVFDKMSDKNNTPFLINAVEYGSLMNRFYNYGKGIGTGIRGISSDKYGYIFESDVKSFLNNDIRFIFGEGFIKYGIIIYYDLFTNVENYSSYYNSIGAGIVLDLAGFAFILYYNYFLNYKESFFSFSMGYKF